MKLRELINRYLLPKKYGIEKVREFGYDLKADLLKLLLGPNSAPVVFDVGANVGQSGKLFRELWPKAIIHSFEPFPEVFAKLSQEAAGDPNWKVHALALANHCGISQFFIHPADYLSGLLPMDQKCPKTDWMAPFNQDGQQTIEVEAVTLDEFCQQAGVPRIDLLKLDVQGAELKVLEGARSLLARQAVDLILAEIILAPLYVNQVKFHEVCAFLDQHGYAFNGLYRPNFDLQHRLAWFDALFWRSAGFVFGSAKPCA